MMRHLRVPCDTYASLNLAPKRLKSERVNLNVLMLRTSPHPFLLPGIRGNGEERILRPHFLHRFP